MMKNSIVTLAVCASFVSVVYIGSGCDEHSHDDDDHTHVDASGGHTSPYPDCQAIIDQCHELDVGEETPIHACHDLAHDAKSNADCTVKKAECFATCVAPTDAGTDSPTTSGDDAGDAGDGG